VEFGVLGPLQVVTDGGAVALGRGRQRAVLAMLLLHANEVVSGDRLIDALWGESPPRTAAAALQNQVSSLRKLLGAGRLETRAPGYVLRVDRGELDLERFEDLFTEARGDRKIGDHASAAEKLRAALALWRGPAFADFAYEPFAQAEIARLEELRLVAFEERVDADLDQGRDAELVGELEAAISDNPLRERLRRQLMLALYRCGRQADALEVYRETSRVLDEELGIAPSPALRRLEAAILNQEQALELRTHETVAPGEAPAGAEAPEVRKTITVMIAVRRGDADLDPELAAREERRFRGDVARVVRHYGGTTAGGVGEQAMAVFGIPSLHEDDALRAASAAVELRDLVGTGERIGIATGEVLASAPGSAAFSVAGPPVALAGELAASASPGEILIAAPTEALVRDFARLEQIEVTAGEAWRLHELAGKQPPLVEPARTPLVGRGAELGKLRAMFDRVVSDRATNLVVVSGPAGIGKTRLVQEFASLIDEEAIVLAGRCVPYGEGITFWPLSEALRQLTTAGSNRFDSPDQEATALAARLAEAIGQGGGAATQEDIFSAARELFEALGRSRPLVLVFEDLHWAEPAFLDLVEFLAQARPGPSILVVCIGRPELLEARPSWGRERPDATTLPLESLAGAEAEAMLGNIAPEVDEATRARVLEVSEGNPLFIEQLVAKLSEESDAGGELAIPATIEAVLAARLDRLGPGERAVISRAAVAGKEFPVHAVTEMLPKDARPFLDRHLQTLTRKELIGAPVRSATGGEEFAFRHVLIQQAAYRAVPKRNRADLHERFGQWVSERPRNGAGERSEIVGYHLEQAYRYRTELGPAGDAEHELARRAGAHLGSAGQRAFGRGDMPATVNLLGRATSLLANEGAGLALLPELGYALFETGEEDRADRLLADARVWARSAGDRAAEWRAIVTRRRVEMYMEPMRTDVDALKTEAEAAIEIFEELDDQAGLARAWLILSDLHWFHGRLTETVDASRRAAAHARAAGNLREVGWTLGQVALCAIHSPMPVGEAIASVERLLEEAAQNRGLDANLAGFLTVLEAMGGDIEGARRRIEETRALARDLGLTWQAAVQELNSGYIELLAGDPAAAEREIRRAKEAFIEIGEGWFLATAACDLPRAVYEQGRYDDAFALAQEIDEKTTFDRENGIRGHGIRARVLARRGELAEAEALARKAVRLGETSEFLVLHADALTDLAEVVRLAGRESEAASAMEEAVRLYERKGNVAAARKARGLVSSAS
jgi:DNA-binding SARP family transcriptional activator